ncbi:LamG-like jellyroll fold domain-containing protein [Dokdonia sp.]|uniref:LamG domain-containing protein n=1 Tax=Dokdonia sp. TaxID=2024995 RepID=UPI003263C532
MKKTMLFLLVGFYWFNLNAQVNLEDGLVAFYPFKGNSIDESTNNNNGSVMGASLVNDRFGNSNSAYNFDGDDYIFVNDSPSLRIVDFSISLWCKFDNTNGLQLMIDKHLGTGALDSYEVWFQSNKVWGTISDFDGFDNFVDTPLNPDLGVWYHIVYTFDDLNNTQSIYVNSVLGSNIVANKSISYDNEPLLIGASNDQQVPKFFFKGDLDDIRIYDRVINQDEIDTLYSETLSIKEFETDLFSIYPNPTSDLIKINSNQIIEEIILYSLNGEILLQESINTIDYEINTANLASGSYIISAKMNIDNKLTFHQKIFIKK